MDRHLCGIMNFATVGKLAQAGDKDNRLGSSKTRGNHIGLKHKRLVLLTHFSSIVVSVGDKFGGGIRILLAIHSFNLCVKRW